MRRITYNRIFVLSLVFFFSFTIFIAIALQTTSLDQSGMSIVTTPGDEPLQAQELPSTWWNKSYRYRIEMNITEPNKAERINEPVDVWINFTDVAPNNVSACGNDSIRVLEYSGSTWTLIPSQVWNVTYKNGNVSTATITFPVNISQGEVKPYYIYYNETGEVISYATSLNDTYNAEVNATINNGLFYLGLSNNSGIYNLSYDAGTLQNYNLLQSLSPLGPTYNYHYGTREFFASQYEWIEIYAFDNNTEIKLLDSSGTVVNSTTLNEFDLLRYPETGSLGVGGEGLYEVVASNPVSTTVTSVYPSSTSNDECWAAYNNKILGRINKNLWIVSQYDDTHVDVLRVDDMTTVLSLDLNYLETHYYTTTSAYTTGELYLITANNPVYVVAGYQYDGFNYVVFSKDMMNFTYPRARGQAIVSLYDNTYIEMDNGNGQTWSGTLDEGGFHYINDNGATYGDYWASVNASKPVQVYARYYGDTGTWPVSQNPVGTHFWIGDPGSGDIIITALYDGTSVTYAGGAPFSLDRGQSSTRSISSSNGGVEITATNPIFLQYYDWDNNRDDTAMYIPMGVIPPRINNITRIENGPVFKKYEINWESVGGMNATDNLTIFTDYEFFRLERNLWFEYGSTNPSFRAIDTYFNGSIFDEYVYDDVLVSSLDNTQFNASNYIAIHDDDPTTLMTLGLFMTDYAGNGAVTLTDTNLTADYYDGIIHLVAGNQTVMTTPTNPTANDFASFTFWEFVKHGINPNPEIVQADDKVFNPLQVSTPSDEQSLFYNLIITLKDIDAYEAVNCTVFLNKTDATTLTNYTLFSDSNGKATFSRLEEGTYSINVSYTDDDFQKTLLLNYTDSVQLDADNTDAKGDLELTISNLPITHYDFTFVNYPEETPLDGANVTFYNYSQGTGYQVLGAKTAVDGDISLYWANTTGTNWNYTMNMSFYGQPRQFRLQPIHNKSREFGNVTCIVTNGSVISGDNASVVFDDETFLTIANETTNTGNLSVTCEWAGITLTDLNAIVLNIRSNYSTTNVSGEAWVYNYTLADWEYMMNLNDSISETLYTKSFDDTDDFSNLISSGQFIVLINGTYDGDFNLSIEEIDLELSYSGSQWDYDYNFTMAQYEANTFESSLADFETELMNWTAKSQTIDYGDNLTFKLRYNYTLEGEATDVGISDATFNVYLSHEGNPANMTGLQFVEEAGAQNKGNYTCIIDTDTQGLLAEENYVFYVETSKAGYQTKFIVFSFTLDAINTSIDVTLNASVYWGQNLSIRVNFTDNQGAEIPDATVTFRWATTSGTLTMNDTDPNEIFYYTEVNTSITLYGHQIVYISASATNYDSITDDVNEFNLLERETRLNDSTEFFYQFTFYALEANNITFNYTDVLTGNPISNATANYIYNGSSYDLIEAGNGYYVFDFDTEYKSIGIYVISLNIKKTNYSQGTAILYISIVQRPTTFDLAGESILTMEEGQVLTLLVDFLDTRTNTALDNFTVQVSISGGTSSTISTSSNGRYTIEISGLPKGTYSIEISVTHENYTVETISVYLEVTWVKIFGIEAPFFYLILILALIGIIAPVAALIIYTSAKRAAIPYQIKKIDETIKYIQKKKADIPTPVMKSKNEIFKEIFEKEWSDLAATSPIFGNASKAKDEFISIMNQIKAVRMTTTEVELLRNQIREMSKEEAIKKLRALGIPPDTAEKLINLVKK